MKKILLILFTILLLNCSKKADTFDLSISNHNYKLDIETGELNIDWYRNYKGQVQFSKEENEKINELIYKYHLDTLKGEKWVCGNEILIMPNFNDVITLKKKNSITSKIYISTQVSLEKSKPNKTEIDIFNFKEEFFKILNKNGDFKRNMDTLKIAKENDKRLFL
ncbi:hypothetical protein [Flavobacterium sp. K5-23]|uniref:hypothetical protein n=1 Tax=Flavobacterium sp. K5-23 TaxID=2746225 RepID=UPI00200ECB82|nr:hypothetical protein [Flavobacterium sp. K5-23]UQD56709.1 hypothetical protein FLAK523_10045 [Flavobacterium sp. K5-23]